MSPRRTETLHELGDGNHLRPVVVIGFESGDLGSKNSLVMKPGSSLNERGTDRFGARHAGCFELAQSTESVVVEPNRYRLSHTLNVSRYVIQGNRRGPRCALVRADIGHSAE